MVNYNPADMTYSADIDGHSYNFTMYDADKGFRTMCEVSYLFGAGLSSLQQAKGIGSEEGQTSLFLAAAKSICTGLGTDTDRSLRLAKRLCCDGVRVDDQPLTQDLFVLHFAGKLPTMLKVVAAALEVQFGNFFDFLKSSMTPASPLTTNSNPSPTTT